jgi:hypothetical protein
MGVPLPFEGPTYTFGDNMSVIKNTSTPESTLRKKSNSIYATTQYANQLQWVRLLLRMNLVFLTQPILPPQFDQAEKQETMWYWVSYTTSLEGKEENNCRYLVHG